MHPLGKGEVVSSILPGSTSFCGFPDEGLRRTVHEHAQRCGSELAQPVPETFSAIPYFRCIPHLGAER